jgi:hypothetical protein
MVDNPNPLFILPEKRGFSANYQKAAHVPGVNAIQTQRQTKRFRHIPPQQSA